MSNNIKPTTVKIKTVRSCFALFILLFYIYLIYVFLGLACTALLKMYDMETLKLVLQINETILINIT